jgi:hypothetical protein
VGQAQLAQHLSFDIGGGAGEFYGPPRVAFGQVQLSQYAVERPDATEQLQLVGGGKSSERNR